MSDKVRPTTWNSLPHMFNANSWLYSDWGESTCGKVGIHKPQHLWSSGLRLKDNRQGQIDHVLWSWNRGNLCATLGIRKHLHYRRARYCWVWGARNRRNCEVHKDDSMNLFISSTPFLWPTTKVMEMSWLRSLGISAFRQSVVDPPRSRSHFHWSLLWTASKRRSPKSHIWLIGAFEHQYSISAVDIISCTWCMIEALSSPFCLLCNFSLSAPPVSGPRLSVSPPTNPSIWTASGACSSSMCLRVRGCIRLVALFSMVGWPHIPICCAGCPASGFDSIIFVTKWLCCGGALERTKWLHWPCYNEPYFRKMKVVHALALGKTSYMPDNVGVRAFT